MKAKIKILLGIVIFLGVMVIGIYPFDNRNLELHFYTETEDVVVCLTNKEIAEESFQDLTIEGVEEIKIKRLVMYGSSKTMPLKRISDRYKLRDYIEKVPNGEIKIENDGIAILASENVCIIWNDLFKEMLKELSSSLLQERIIIIGYFFCFVAIIFFVYNILYERRNKNSFYNHGPCFEIKKFFKDIYKYRQYIIYAAKTDLKAEVANSYLNRLWWLLEPFFNMIVYVIVFGNIMGSSIENYATFIFSALLLWNFFSKTLSYSVKLVRNNRDILSKVYIPKFVLLLSNMILNLFKLFFSLSVLVVMMIVFHIRIGINIIWVLPSFFTLTVLTFGIGMILLNFGVYVDDLSYAVSILLSMLMLLSGVFYEPIASLPEPLNVIMICMNPVAALIDTTRNALLQNTAANLPILCMWFFISIILCSIGVHTVYKNENSYVKVV